MFKKHKYINKLVYTLVSFFHTVRLYTSRLFTWYIYTDTHIGKSNHYPPALPYTLTIDRKVQ